MTDTRFYTISELAKEFGVTTRTIRFYEEKGLIHPAAGGPEAPVHPRRQGAYQA